MSAAKWSALLSLVAAIAIVGASFLQWWDVTYGGDLRMRWWVKLLLITMLIVLVASLVLLLLSE